MYNVAEIAGQWYVIYQGNFNSRVSSISPNIPCWRQYAHVSTQKAALELADYKNSQPLEQAEQELASLDARNDYTVQAKMHNA